jgi:hypothetical protein
MIEKKWEQVKWPGKQGTQLSTRREKGLDLEAPKPMRAALLFHGISWL